MQTILEALRVVVGSKLTHRWRECVAKTGWRRVEHIRAAKLAVKLLMLETPVAEAGEARQESKATR